MAFTEKLLIATLWVLLSIVLAAPYLIYSVRQRNFFPRLGDCAIVEQAIVRIYESKDQAADRLALWRREKATNQNLREILGEDHHLAEVTNQIGKAALDAEHNLDRYFMTQARDIKEEEYQKLEVINFAANVGPVIGFAGTILGMILAFSQLGQSVSKEMMANIASAIYIALITTLFGLVIKALAAFMKFVIQHQIDKFATRIFTISSNITAMLHNRAPANEGEDN